MAQMFFCPDAATWGDLATWASAVGALLVGGAIVLISHRTNRLAASGNQINQSLQQIEEQRDDAREKAEAERRILALASMGVQVNLIKAQVEALLSEVQKKDVQKRFLSDEGATTDLIPRAKSLRSLFPLEVSSIAREISLEEGARLMRAASIPVSLVALLISLEGSDDHAKHRTYLNIVIFLNIALNDLKILCKACSEADDACGMRDVPTPEMLEALARARGDGH